MLFFYRSALVLFLLVGPLVLSAQEFLISQGGTISTCTGTLLDSGGRGGNHAGGRQQVTVCPDNSTGASLRVFFSLIRVNGELRVLNGPTAMSPILRIVDESFEGETFTERATAANTSGCLTFVFEPNSGTPDDGWVASISCVQACQPIEAELVSTTPAAVVDGEFSFIDVCPGDEITFNARANYPESGEIYTQSDALSTFRWTFQDDSPAQEGTSVTHSFAEPGGYTVELQVIDQNDCRNGTRLIQRVRVSAAPDFNELENVPESICVGEEITVHPEETVDEVWTEPTPRTFTFAESQTFSDLVRLPDQKGILFRSPLEFLNFDSDQVMESPSDIVRICASIEHAYLGDLEIWLECPDGSIMTLHNFDDNDAVVGQTLGMGNRFTAAPDPPDPPGLYCWTPQATRSIAQVVEQTPIIPSEMVPEGDYAPDGSSFDDLVGCPLNGEWSLNVIDSLEQDNGAIYSWSIEFSTDLFPDPIRFTPELIDVRIQDNGVYTANADGSSTISTGNPGPRKIRVLTEDELGCSFDTTYVLDVESPFSSDCVNCDDLPDIPERTESICAGESFSVDYSQAIPPDTVVTWESVAFDPVSNALFPSSAQAYGSVISVSDHAPTTIGDAGVDIESVCVNFNNLGDLSDLTIQLVSPSGTRFRLLENGGGNGTDLVGACFTPDATTPVSGSPGAFTGEFQAAGGDWSVFNGDDFNGDWTLEAWDEGGNDVGRLISWSIGLRYDRGLTFSWAPADGTLSCTDCPDPTITPTSTGSYTLTITTRNGCTREAVIVVDNNALNVLTLVDQSDPGCPGEANGTIIADVDDSGGPLTLSWSDEPANSSLTRTGLPAGTYTLTAMDAQGCSEMLEVILETPPLLTIGTAATMMANCNGEATGSIAVSEITGGTEPYTLVWDDSEAQTTLEATNLPAGTYTLVVTDAAGCTATLTETVSEPDALLVDVTSTAVVCLGADDGTAIPTVSGGTPPYAFAWSTGSTDEELLSLGAGDYSLEITDASGCTARTTFSVAEPSAPLTVTAVQDELACNGTDANVATANPTGGSGGYTYAWSNGETTRTATMLPVGAVSVTVTDDGGCAQEATIVLNELPPVEVLLTFDEPTCNNRDDATILASPSGGAGGTADQYTYVWSTGASTRQLTDLPAGQSYSVTVTDSRGCTGEASAFIPVPPPITFSSDMTRVSCFGEPDGGLTLSDITGPTGGPFSVQWSPEAGGGTDLSTTGLAAGTYELRVTDATGCFVDTSLVITEPMLLEPLTEVTDVSCNGETDAVITAQGTGGTPPYSFLWSNGSTNPTITNLAAGTYGLTLTDVNGCESITSYTPIEPDPLFAEPMASPVLCAGGFTGQVTIDVVGGVGPYLYGFTGRGDSRNPTVLGLAAGTYGTTVTDANGCTDTAPVTVEDGLEFFVDAGMDSTIIFGDSIFLDATATGGQGGATYEWFPSAPTLIRCDSFFGLDTIACQRPLILPQFETDFTVVATDANGCTAEDRVRISVRKIREVAVPTGFSPDNNGQNDLLLVHGRPGTFVVSFQVFDRQTNLLYEDANFDVNDPTRGWDGTDEGRLVNAGVYLYKLVVRYEDFSQETLTGHTTLIR